MKSACDVSVIIVNYNGKKYLDNLLQSLQNMDSNELTYEVIVVDNCSTDDSVSFMKQHYEKKMPLKIIESKENLGFAGGNNKGVQEALGHYIVFLNNDTAVERNWLTELYRFMQEHPDCGMVNSKLLFFYNFIKFKFSTDDKIILNANIRINGQNYEVDNKFCKNLLLENKKLTCFGNSEISVPLLLGIRDYEIEIECIEGCGKRNEILLENNDIKLLPKKSVRIILEKQYVEKHQFCLIQNAGSGINENYDGFDIGFCDIDKEEYSTPYEITNGCGAAIMLFKEDFIRCGGFDEQFFMYYEDTDMSFRLRKLGKKIMFCPTAVVRHVHTGSSKEWSPFFCYQVARNKLLFIYKNISKFKFWIFFVRQIFSAFKYRNEAQKRGSVDAVKMAIFHRRCAFNK